MRRLAPLSLALAVLSGCLLNSITPGQKLNERVQEFSDATRWNRIDIASQMVVADFRQSFMQQHARWGRSVEVADAELLALQMAPDGNSATSTIAYSWYDLSAMTLTRTTLQQTWNVREGYRVTNEVVTEGDPGLLSQPTVAADTTTTPVAALQ